MKSPLGLGVTGVLLLTAVMTGCAGPELTRQGTLKVERVPAENVEFTWVRAYGLNGETRVAGGVDPSGWSHQWSPSDHADVELLDETGAVIATDQAPYTVSRSNQSPARPARFDANVNAGAPEGGTVRIAHHSGQHEEAGSTR